MDGSGGGAFNLRPSPSKLIQMNPRGALDARHFDACTRAYGERKLGRIRTIKPEFPQSESVGRLSRDARLLFIQLWTIVDDSGRTRGNSRMLASLLYPYDPDAPMLIGSWLDELEAQEHICRYQVANQNYVQVVNFNIHQKIDKPSPSKFPAFDESSTSPREDSRCIKEGIKDQGPVSVPGKLAREEAKSPDTVDARVLSERVGIFEIRQQEAMHRLLCAFHAASIGMTVEAAVDYMAGRWSEYQAKANELGWQYGSSYKFFMSGNWDKPGMWPPKAKSRSEEIKAWKAPDDED